MKYAAEQGHIRVALAGDSMLMRGISVFQEREFLSLRETIRSADIAVTNVETVFHDLEHAPTCVSGGTYMHTPPEVIEDLKWMGFEIVAAANNHAYDYGEDGLVTHMGHMRARDLAFAGIGETMGAARAPTYVEHNAGRIALISATSSGPASLYAQHQWRDGRGRPGANMIRFTSEYTVDQPIFDALRRMRDELGLQGLRHPAHGNHSFGISLIPDTDTDFYMGDLQSAMQYPVPSGYRFVRGDELAWRPVPNQEDIEENLQRISDARRMADWVIVSFHNHEKGATPSDPPQMTVEFAHSAIDAGADIFHGHGPHLDRGIEIYKGKPIFYSIGTFVAQNESVDHVPLDNVVRLGLSNPWEATPADFYDARSGRESLGEWKGPFDKPDRWRSFIAVVEFKQRELTGVRLQPIELGYRRPRYQRGRPMIADSGESQEELKLLRALSEPYGTKVEVRGDIGYIGSDPLLMG